MAAVRRLDLAADERALVDRLRLAALEALDFLAADEPRAFLTSAVPAAASAAAPTTAAATPAVRECVSARMALAAEPSRVEEEEAFDVMGVISVR